MQPQKSKLKIVIGLAIVVIVAFSAYRFFLKKQIVYAGNINATRVELPARLATVIAKINVQEGDVVQKDQVLLELACEDLKVSEKFMSANYERSARLFRSGSISQEAFDVASNKRDEIQVKLNWCQIKSTISGIVLNRYLEVGEWVSPGTKLISVADLDDMYAYVYVSQETMANLKVGDKVVGEIPEINNGHFEGVIRKINEEAEFTPKNVQTRSERTRLVYGVKVALPNQDRKLKPGMTIELEL